MHVRGGLLLLILVLAGCAGPTEGPAAEGTPTLPGAPGAGGECLCMDVASAPVLRVGQAWTYEGVEFYNEDATRTVVVARADAEGYLFAGGAQDDVVYDALWGSLWFGERTLDLAEGESPTLLQFPLTDGATWTYVEGLDVTARAAEVDTPVGPRAGFVMEGASDRISLRIEYAPEIGNVVRYTATRADGTVRDDVRMTRLAEGQPWVWYERGDITVVPNPHEPATFEVPEGRDAVLVSAGGLEGSRALVQGPTADAAWSVEFAKTQETWRQTILPAPAGRWEAAVAGRPFVDGAPDLPAAAPMGWAYLHAAAVTWVEGR